VYYNFIVQDMAFEREVAAMMDFVFTVSLIIGFGLLFLFAGWCDKQVGK
jgi:hypothetical protein